MASQEREAAAGQGTLEFHLFGEEVTDGSAGRLWCCDYEEAE